METPNSSCAKIPFAAGMVLSGRYEILRCLAYGRTAHVFVALDHKMTSDDHSGMLCALKFLNQDLRHRCDLEKSFLREQYFLAANLHPGIVRFLNTDEYSGIPFLVTEYLDGIRLDEWRSRERSRIDQWEQATKIGRQIAVTLDFLHTRGFVHGDIKPSNVIITHSGIAKLIDFGSARYANDTKPPSLLDGFTPRYATRERLNGHAALPADDLYSLARLVHLLATDNGDGDPNAKPFDIKASHWCALRRALVPSRAAQFGTAQEMIDQIFEECSEKK